MSPTICGTWSRLLLIILSVFDLKWACGAGAGGWKTGQQQQQRLGRKTTTSLFFLVFLPSNLAQLRSFKILFQAKNSEEISELRGHS